VKSSGRTIAPLLLLLGIAACSAALAWRARVVDRWMRDDLLLHTRLIARTVTPGMLAGLTGTKDDLSRPTYQRLKNQFESTRGAYPEARYIYLMIRRADGGIAELLDSDPPDAEAPPGLSYPEATEELRRVFRGGAPIVEGPVADRWGTWVSALVPIRDPATGTAVAVLGMDVDATVWRAKILRSLRPFAILLALIGAVGWIGSASLRWRAGLPHQRQAGPLRHIEAGLAVAIGLLLTLCLAVGADQNERREHWATFSRLAASAIDLVNDAIADIRDVELEGLARLFESSDFVDRAEFVYYAGFLTHSAFAQSWEWVPAVPVAELAAFEAAARSNGSPEFAVWQPVAGGGREPPSGRDISYPICYIAPAVGNEPAIGFDLGSDPARRAALETAAATRLMTASEPVPLVQAADGARGIRVFRAVFRRDSPDKLNGFVGVTLRMDAYLAAALEPLLADAPVAIAIEQLRVDAPPLRLAAAQDPGSEGSALRMLAPVYAFGQTYAVACRPSTWFHRLYAPLGALRATVGGCLATAVVAIALAFQRYRQTTLEQMVRERTADLRRSEAQLIEAQRMARIGSWELDLRTKSFHCSQEFRRLFGRDPAESGASCAAYRDAIHPEDRAMVEQALARSAQSRTPCDIAYRLVLPDGLTRHVRERCETDCDEDGRPVRSAGTVQDITDLKQAEAEREQLQEQLLQARKMESIGRLAGGVAHDFNNMLQAVIGNASLALAEAPPGSALREHIEEIGKSAGRSADVARQLLAFASRQTVSPRVLDLNDTVEGMLKMLRRLIGEEIELQWMPGPDLWPIRMDPSQIDQILANLAVNARDAIGGVGQVAIETRNYACDEFCARDFPGCAGGEYVQLVVRDTGRGMDDETRAHIFEPFFTTKPRGKGTGLGLATVFGIVRQNRGFIEVDSKPGEGATFRILLPRTELPPGGIDAPAAAPQTVRSGGECILIVEDEASILKLSRAALARLGYTVLTAATPAEAIARAAEHSGGIDLLITDVVLPEMNGPELVRRLTAVRPGMKYLFMSGYTADVIAERGVLDEGTPFIQKPFSLDALTAKVREVLEGPPHA
jgi:C4-dicarboxylate-specific signal transduction histidine kinase